MAMFLTSILFLVLNVPSEPATLPPGNGQAIVQQKCSTCHALKVVTGKKASKQQWSTIVDQMITRGADVPDDDIETVVDYLTKNFGPSAGQAGAEKSEKGTGPVNVNTAPASELTAALDLTTQESTSIVAYREQNGKFKEWRDLTRVPGIDAKKIESNKDRLVF
ncbi:MAG: helix-hairpin-helix domain-containing protein [Candidatus Sulfotelmatobacter sp.]